jgi:hypothetical protein
MVLETLLISKYIINADETERLKIYIFDTFGILTWIIASQVSLHNNNNAALYTEMNKEFIRWTNYLQNLLILTYDNRNVPERGKNLKEKKDDLSRSIPEMAGIIYGNTAKPESFDFSDPGYYKKKLKKLQRYFPCEIPEYKNLLEDIINCDYNLINVWTKACTIRNIQEIDEEDLGESVVALLFSPEEILHEEAARLIARSGKELYRTTSERIPEINRKQLDRIIAGETIEKELVYEKVRFLSSCFKEINEDELLFLAEKMSFVRNDGSGIFSQESGTIIWSFSEEKPDPVVIVINEDSTDSGRVIKDIRTTSSFCYVLPLNAVREFNFQYPERSLGIFKFIDESEE